MFEEKAIKQRIQLCQKYIDLLKLPIKVEQDESQFYHNFELNVQLSKEESQLILQVTNGIRYIFIDPEPQNNLPISNHANEQYIQDSMKYSIMTLFYYSLSIDDGLYKRNGSLYSICNNPQDFIMISNHFMRVLQNQRVYNTLDQIVWSSWNTYWSNFNRTSICFSNCSGVCNDSCAGAQCLYYFPQNELQNPNLPDQEKVDENNIFNDDLYWLAGQFNEFVKQKSNFENFFLAESCGRKYNSYGRMQLIGYGRIHLRLLSGQITKLNKLSELRGFERDQICSLSILGLEESEIPQDESTRTDLYQFILSLPNLRDLEIQLEKGILTFTTISKGANLLSKEKFVHPPQPDFGLIIRNLTEFLLSLKVVNLSLILDEFCYPSTINLDRLISSLPNLNQSVKNLYLSMKWRRMRESSSIFRELCRIKQLEKLIVNIREQYNINGNTYSAPQDVSYWVKELKSSLPFLQYLEVF